MKSDNDYNKNRIDKIEEQIAYIKDQIITKDYLQETEVRDYITTIIYILSDITQQIRELRDSQ